MYGVGVGVGVGWVTAARKATICITHPPNPSEATCAVRTGRGNHAVFHDVVIRTG